MRLVRRRVSELEPAPYNPREISEKAFAGLRASVREFGLVQPIIVNERTGLVVGGHQRLKAMEAEGIDETDVVLVDLDDAQERALNLALNNQAITGTWTAGALEVLKDVVAQLPELHADLRLGEVEAIALKLQELNPGAASDDHVPAPPDEATTRPGDLWILGRHRLLCGDSSKPEDVDRLVDGQPIHLVNTDPPYNVKVEPRSNNAISAGMSSFSSTHHQGLDVARHPSKGKATHDKLRAKDRPLANDFVSDEEFDRLLRAWFGNLERVLVPGGAFYIWGGFSNLANYPPALAECDLYFSQSIVWDKQHPVLTRKDFMTAHEQCFYGWKKGAPHRFFGPANVPDLWPVKKVTPQSMVHLTEKPVELAARAIMYSTRPGENVIDLFGGSGSTLIACERNERSAFLMELDPLYCDVIVERWEAATGQRARRTDASGRDISARDHAASRAVDADE